MAPYNEAMQDSANSPVQTDGTESATGDVAEMTGGGSPRGPWWWRHAVLVPLLLAVAGLLAVTSLLGDSLTFDELSHLTSGVSYWETGDFRLAPDHPPLAKLWAALPFAFIEHDWPTMPQAWQIGSVWDMGYLWFHVANDGPALLPWARMMIVLLLLATAGSIYVAARRLFGPTAGLLGLGLAVLSPTLLAHGRYVTTDLPLALGCLATIYAYARLVERLSWGWLVAASLALAATSVTKFSWPVVLVPLLAMGMYAVFRPTPMHCAMWPAGVRKRWTGSSGSLVLRSVARRAAAVLGVAAFSGVIVWLGIWTTYGWRYSPFRGADADAAMMISPSHPGEPPASTMAQAWMAVLTDWEGEPREGTVPAFVRWARERRVLPEAYLYGLAFTGKTTAQRASYLNGHISTTGWPMYFPIAFVLKTPLGLILLMCAGVAALAARRLIPVRDAALLLGLGSFVAVYGIAVAASAMNIGHRHLVPIYPPLIVLAAAAAGWLRWRAGRWLITGATLWLVGANLFIYPHYLAYFNELIGGPAQGHRYLADSNIDWGQDLKRLATWQQQRRATASDTGDAGGAGSATSEASVMAAADRPIKLAYFGSAEPRAYGVDAELLAYPFPVSEQASLTAGTYVLSVNYWLGIYEPAARDEFWNAATEDAYARLYMTATRPLPPGAPERERAAQVVAARRLATLQRGRLLHRLQPKEPVARIGYSMVVYELTDEDIEDMLFPSLGGRQE
jgi:4-amino-4-deoxy-L-arabinose transferase-like glycosyltransferase